MTFAFSPSAPREPPESQCGDLQSGPPPTTERLNRLICDFKPKSGSFYSLILRVPGSAVVLVVVFRRRPRDCLVLVDRSEAVLNSNLISGMPWRFRDQSGHLVGAGKPNLFDWIFPLASASSESVPRCELSADNQSQVPKVTNFRSKGVPTFLLS